jgi:hypothetical protein
MNRNILMGLKGQPFTHSFLWVDYDFSGKRKPRHLITALRQGKDIRGIRSKYRPQKLEKQ